MEEFHLPNVDRILDAVSRLGWDDTPAAASAGGSAHP